MNNARECHNRAEALATLALMFPESAERYRAKEQHWRDQEVAARRAAAKLASNPQERITARERPPASPK